MVQLWCYQEGKKNKTEIFIDISRQCDKQYHFTDHRKTETSDWLQNVHVHWNVTGKSIMIKTIWPFYWPSFVYLNNTQKNCTCLCFKKSDYIRILAWKQPSLNFCCIICENRRTRPAEGKTTPRHVTKKKTFSYWGTRRDNPGHKHGTPNHFIWGKLLLKHIEPILLFYIYSFIIYLDISYF
jgi:hypothetical protein